MLLGLISAMMRGIRGDAKAAREAWDDALSEDAAATNYLEDHFFSAREDDTLLLLDIPDAFWDNPRRNELFGLLRFWSQSAGPWNRLKLLIAYSTTPSVWAGSPNESPFNIEPVLITDWSAEEVERAASRHGLPRASAAVLQLLIGHIGGHPYLARTLLYHAGTSGNGLDECVARLADDPGPLRGALEMMFARCRLREDESLRKALLAVADRSAPLDYGQYRRLADAGLVVGTSREPRLRAPIAARVLRGE